MSATNFDRWFAGSKVVDADGAPLVVYHGTKSDFETFDPSRGELGTHFSIDPDVASGFAERDGGRVMPVYLNLKNPVRIADFGSWDVFLTIDALHAQGALTAKQTSEIRRAINESEYSDTLVHAALRSSGVDGIVYDNEGEGGGDSYIVFDASLVASAFDWQVVRERMRG